MIYIYIYIYIIPTQNCHSAHIVRQRKANIITIITVEDKITLL